jgi:hypothetical protein
MRKEETSQPRVQQKELLQGTFLGREKLKQKAPEVTIREYCSRGSAATATTRERLTV